VVVTGATLRHDTADRHDGGHVIVCSRHLDEQQQQQRERRVLDEIGVHADGALEVRIAAKAAELIAQRLKY